MHEVGSLESLTSLRLMMRYLIVRRLPSSLRVAARKHTYSGLVPPHGLSGENESESSVTCSSSKVQLNASAI